MFFQPTSLSDACRLRASYRQAEIVNGATDVYARRSGTVRTQLIDISGIQSIRRLDASETEIRIGAGVTWSALRDAALPPFMAALQQAAAQIGGLQIQNRGTIGGNICNGSPAADGLPPLLALGSDVIVTSAVGQRRLPLHDFLNSEVRLSSDELLEAVIITHQPTSTSAFVKLGRRTDLAISVVVTAVLVNWSSDDRVAGARACVGAASKLPERISSLERRLVGMRRADLKGTVVFMSDVDDLTPIDDLRATAQYRRHAALVTLDRALKIAADTK